MSMITKFRSNRPKQPSAIAAESADSTFRCMHEFLGNRFVYATVSARAHGLAIGVNMNPNGHCNFDCEYCDVVRAGRDGGTALEVEVVADELERMLNLVHSGELQNFYAYRNTPPDLMRLQHIALSGDGEPTLCPNFLDVVQAVVHVRARGRFPFFKIVLITNASGLDLRAVQDALKLFTSQDEIWAKLEAGTQSYMEAVNHPDCSLDKILENILLVARQRPIVIQGLFPLLNNIEPATDEIEQYARRLNDLKRAGAQISRVQIYSATRQSANLGCGHLPLKSLTRIARCVREVSGLITEVF